MTDKGTSMFDKILIANRGARAEGAGVRSHLCEAHVMRTPNGMAHAVCAGDFIAMEPNHV